MARDDLSNEQLDQILAGDHEQHQIFPAVDAALRPVALPPVEAPANPQPPMAARTAHEEGLALLLASGSAVGLPQQIERE